MKKSILAVAVLIVFSSAVWAQDLIWEEDFGTGCNQGQLATAYAGPNGNWTMTNTGTNTATSNTWYVSAAENGMAPGQCGAGCGSNRTLHLGAVFLGADPGAAYYDSGLPSFCAAFGACGATDRRAESPAINATGYTDLTLTFDYIEGGNTTDNATLWYNPGSGWVQLEDTPKTLCCGGVACNGSLQGLWTSRTVSLPATADENPSFRFAFRWINNDDGIATDPSFAVDNIKVFGTSTASELCYGDFNGNGLIDYGDMSFFLAAYGSTNPQADSNNDGTVNFSDLTTFLAVYGTECP